MISSRMPSGQTHLAIKHLLKLY